MEHNNDKRKSGDAVLFELSVLGASVVAYLLLRKYDKNIGRKYIFTFIGVLLFEYFTHPLWINKVEPWAYFYIPKSKGLIDMSWVITLGWTTILVASMHIVDSVYKKASERKRFIGYIALVTVVGLFAEYFVRLIGIREYAQGVYDVLTGIMIGGLLPIEALYYIPVFMALVIGFSRYWSMSFQQNGAATAKAPRPRVRTRRRK